MQLRKALLLTAAGFPLALGAQQTDSTSTTTPPSSPEGASSQAQPAQVSGTLFGNYMYQTGKAAAGQNSFNFERAYITAWAQLSDRTSGRVTADIDPNSSSGSGYQFRLKYGYMQYDYLKGANWSANLRGGMLQTVFIDHEENYWPRWIAKTPTELAGFFQAADLGASTLITMPNKWGEIYAAVTNGPGYTTTHDPDRFKDYQARVSLTPFVSGQGFLSSFDLTGWYYRGAVGRTVSATTTSLDKDRWGVFAGVRDPRLTIGVDYAENKDQSALTATTDTSVTGRLWSAYTVLRPFEFVTGSTSSPFGIVLRYDQVKPNKSVDDNYSLFVGGVTVDLSKRVSFSVDYQEVATHNGASTSGAFFSQFAAPKAAYMHWVVNY